MAIKALYNQFDRDGGYGDEHRVAIYVRSFEYPALSKIDNFNTQGNKVKPLFEQMYSGAMSLAKRALMEAPPHNEFGCG